MSVRHETMIEHAGDYAEALPIEAVPAEVKAAVIEKCNAAYRAADGIDFYSYDEARPQVYAAVDLLDDALQMLPTADEAVKEVRQLRVALAKAQDALEDFLADVENDR